MLLAESRVGLVASGCIWKLKLFMSLMVRFGLSCFGEEFISLVSKTDELADCWTWGKLVSSSPALVELTIDFRKVSLRSSCLVYCRADLSFIGELCNGFIVLKFLG